MRVEEFETARRRITKWTDYKRSTFYIWLAQYYKLNTISDIRRWLKSSMTTFRDFSNVVATFEALHCSGPIGRKIRQPTLAEHMRHMSMRGRTLRG